MQRPCQDLDYQSKSLAMSRLNFFGLKRRRANVPRMGTTGSVFGTANSDFYRLSDLI
jgi:hypothetical protein